MSNPSPDDRRCNPTVISLGPLRRERWEALAAVLARILVAQSLVEAGLQPANDEAPP